MVDTSHRMPTRVIKQICVWQFNFFLRTVPSMLWKRLPPASIYSLPLSCYKLIHRFWDCLLKLGMLQYVSCMFRLATAWGNTAEQPEACGTWSSCRSGHPASHRQPDFAIPIDFESSFLPRTFSSDCPKFTCRDFWYPSGFLAMINGCTWYLVSSLQACYLSLGMGSMSVSFYNLHPCATILL